MAENQIVKYMTDTGEVQLSSEFVKSYLVSGSPELVTDQEMTLFLNLCQYQHLNPFLREAYLIKYSKNDPAQVVTGKDVFTKRANKNPNLEYFTAGIICEKDGEEIEREGARVPTSYILKAGWSEVKRKDRERPKRIEVDLAEYDKGQATWKKMPATMIRKVALVQNLRESFPEDFQGLYSEEEEATITTIDITPKKDQIKPTVSKSEKDKSAGQAQALVAVMMKAGATKDDISLILNRKVQDQSHISQDEFDYLNGIFADGTWKQTVSELRELAEIGNES